MNSPAHSEESKSNSSRNLHVQQEETIARPNECSWNSKDDVFFGIKPFKLAEV